MATRITDPSWVVPLDPPLGWQDGGLSYAWDAPAGLWVSLDAGSGGITGTASITEAADNLAASGFAIAPAFETIAFGGALGSANTKTAGTTLTLTTGVAVPAGSLVVVYAAADNLSASTPTFSASDSKGNTYGVEAQGAVNATAAAGVAGAILASVTTTALTSTDTITVTVSGSVAARAIRAEYFTGATATDRTAPVVTTGASTTPSVTTGSATTGDLVLGMVAVEDSATPTFDSDTVNGSWSTGQRSATAGSTAATNVYTASQYKIVTGTGTQTYNLTTTNTDWVAIGAVLTPKPIPANFGTAAIVEAADTMSASGTYADNNVTGTAALVEAADTLAASGTATPPTITGTASITEAADTMSASGTYTSPSYTGTAAITEAADTMAASGTYTSPSYTGSGAITEAADTMSATGTYTPATITGTAVITEAADTLAASGTYTAPGAITGNAAIVEAADTLSASGTATAPSYTGTAAITEAADTLSASGTYTPATIVGSASITEAADTMAASGTVSAPGAITGSAALTEAADTMSASGTVSGAAPITGTAAIVEAADTLVASGTFSIATITGTAAITEARDTLSATGTVDDGTIPPIVYHRLITHQEPGLITHTEPATVTVTGDRMRSVTLNYRTVDEDPAIAIEWRDRAGSIIDFTGATFTMLISPLSGGTVTQKQAGIVGASTSPNVVITWSAGELATLGVGTYSWLLTATVGGRDRTINAGTPGRLVVVT